MKEFILPEKWYLLFEDRTQFEICRDYFNTSWDFTGRGGCHNGSFWNSYMNGSNDINIIELKGFKRITFDQFKQYVLKQKPEKMKKPDFTIEGSVALKKDFIEECVHYVFRHVELSKLNPYYLTPCRSEKNFGKLTFTPEKKYLHFNLNTQYGEALEYVREYFKPEEPEFKVGDWICVLGNGFNDTGHDNYKNPARKGDFIQITGFSESTSSEKKVAICGGGYVVYIEDFPEDFRHATPEEIEEYNNPKLPEIEGYEGEYSCGLIKYGCAELLPEWFSESKTRSIKSMALSSGVEINEEQMNQIRKVVNAKTK